METTRARDHSVEARPNLRNRPACAPSPLASAIIIQSRSRWSHAAARLEDIRLSPSPAVAHAPDQPDSSASVERLHQLVLRSLDDDQAIAVVSIPLSGKPSIATHKLGNQACR